MIVPMKKVFIIAQDKDAEDMLTSLRRFGVVHIEHIRMPKGEDINALQADIALLTEAIRIASLFKQDNPKINEPVDRRTVARRIVDLHKRLMQLEDCSSALRQKISEWEEWGDFEPAEIKSLEEKGVYLRLFRIPTKELKNLPQDIAIETVSIRGGIANCVLVSQEKKEIAYKETPLPKMSLSSLRLRLQEELRMRSRIEEELKKEAGLKIVLSNVKAQLEKQLEFQEALRGMGREDSFVYLSGYVPQENVAALEAHAKKHNLGILVRDPAQDEEAPVLIKNPAWISIVKPIFNFLQILPGYRELDISLPFLIFFSIFFGMLIGDAGYGLIYAAITFWWQRKTASKNKDTGVFVLFYILSISAVIWGVLTGTFFGHEWVLKAGYPSLLPALNSEKNLQRFCFFLGALHLSLAHLWRAWLKLPSLSALADVGWALVLWAVFFIAKSLVIGDSFPLFGNWLVIAGVVCIIFFTHPQKNIFRAIAEGLGMGMLPLSLMSTFTDVVSYIRLFAVGLAGVAIADAFNAMAGMIGTKSIFTLIAASLIAIIGNALGVVLGPVSVLVHGLRLNVLEFSGHANVSWSGRPYKPLQD
ncbi:MAG: hypothetical protein NC923_04030 [Candidatus Omnitrophica bacterium]|nr:hypothetical protein [Candidatus Omnitrophota bacterium]